MFPRGVGPTVHQTANIVIDSVVSSNDPMLVGERNAVTVTFSNVGDGTGRADLEAVMSGAVNETQFIADIQMGPGDSRSLSFNVRPQQAGDLTMVIDDFTTTFAVVQPGGGNGDDGTNGTNGGDDGTNGTNGGDDGTDGTNGGDDGTNGTNGGGGTPGPSESNTGLLLLLVGGAAIALAAGDDGGFSIR